MGASVELPVLFCPGTGYGAQAKTVGQICGTQLVSPLFVDGYGRLVCVWCARKIPHAVRPVTKEAEGWVPGAGPVLDPYDAVRLLVSFGGRILSAEGSR